MRGNLGLRGGMRGNLVLEAALGLHGVRDGPDIARIDVENLLRVVELEVVVLMEHPLHRAASRRMSVERGSLFRQGFLLLGRLVAKFCNLLI